MPNKEIFCYSDIQANLISLLQSKMRGIDNDQGNNFSYKDQSGNFHVTANQKYWNGSAWVYEDNSFGNVTITAGKTLFTRTIKALDTNGIQIGNSSGNGLSIDHTEGDITIDKDLLVQNSYVFKLGGTQASPSSTLNWSSSTLNIYSTENISLVASTGLITLDLNVSSGHYTKIIKRTILTDGLSVALVTHGKLQSGTMQDGFGVAHEFWLDDWNTPTPTVRNVATLEVHWQDISTPYPQVGLWVASAQDSYNKKLLMTWDSLVSGANWWCICYANMIFETSKYLEVNKIRPVSSATNLSLTAWASTAGWELNGTDAKLRGIDNGTTAVDIFSKAYGSGLDEDFYNYSSSSIGGFSATPVKRVFYRRTGGYVTVWFYIAGTSNADAFTFTIPYSGGGAILGTFLNTCQVSVGSTYENGYVTLAQDSKTAIITRANGSAWPTSGDKAGLGTLIYFVDDVS